MKNPAATVYFVDVGQGSCQVIVFEDGSIYLIDCGKDPIPLVELLKKIEQDSGLEQDTLRITGIVLSHLHEDHIGGVVQILKQFENRIDHVFVSQDRSPDKILANEVIKKIFEESEKPNSFSVSLLVYFGVTCGKIHPPPGKKLRASLSIMYPQARDSLIAQTQSDVNQGSGVMLLQCGRRRILFPGDAGKLAFEAIKGKRGTRPKFRCDILAAPHHGGRLSNKAEVYPGYSDAYSWLFGEILESKRTVFSVGTGNNHSHPMAEHVQAAVRNGSKVICTQLTNQCHTALHTLGESLVEIKQPSACQREGTGCAGTIVAFLNGREAKISRWNTHQKKVRELSKSQSPPPLCLR